MRQIRVRRHIRLIAGVPREIPAHWRRIGDAEPKVGAVVRDDRTGELFWEVETICALAEMPDGAEGVEMNKVNHGGPAFPVPGLSNLPNGGYIHPECGMSMRQYAAIKLRVPNSGTDWLDEMIRTSLRDELAAKAMQGYLSNSWQAKELDSLGESSSQQMAIVAEISYAMSDATLAARGEEK